MRRFISMLVFMLTTLQCTCLYSKDVLYPNVRHAAQKNIYIKKVNILGTTTQVDFLYRSNEATSRYIYLSLPKDGDSMYIKIKDRKYKLLFTTGIANKDGQTICHPKQEMEFSAIFEAIPEDTKELDIIEGDKGTWHFFGVELRNDEVGHEDLCQLNIYKAYYNNEDITSYALDCKAYIMLYSVNKELYLKIAWPLEQRYSWGKLILVNIEKVDTKEGDFDVSFAKWQYRNSCDNNSGVATITIGKQNQTNNIFVEVSANNNISMFYTTEIMGSMWPVFSELNVKKNTHTPNNKRKTLQKNPNFKIE